MEYYDDNQDMNISLGKSVYNNSSPQKIKTKILSNVVHIKK